MAVNWFMEPLQGGGTEAQDVKPLLILGWDKGWAQRQKTKGTGTGLAWQVEPLTQAIATCFLLLSHNDSGVLIEMPHRVPGVCSGRGMQQGTLSLPNVQLNPVLQLALQKARGQRTPAQGGGAPYHAIRFA